MTLTKSVIKIYRENQSLIYYHRDSTIALDTIYRDLIYQADENMHVSCLPEAMDDVDITVITFMYTGGQVRFLPGPGNKTFAEILPDLNDSNYFVIVLVDPVQPDAVNAVSQLAALRP
jgi:hypothetical protein